MIQEIGVLLGNGKTANKRIIVKTEKQAIQALAYIGKKYGAVSQSWAQVYENLDQYVIYFTEDK